MYADLPKAKNRPCVSEDSVAMMQMDYTMFFSYVKENKSSEFYKIFRNIVKKGYLDLTADAIIANKKLYLNEKYSLLLSIPAMDQANLFGNKILKTRGESSGDSKCFEAYEDERRSCGIDYGISCGLSCFGGVIIGGLGILWATDQLNDCLDKARETYINCQKLEAKR